jgi:hypothetical protein
VDAGDVKELSLDRFQDVEACAAGHLVIEDREVDRTSTHDLEGVISAPSFDDLESGASEEVAYARTQGEVVVCDEDAAVDGAGVAHGYEVSFPDTCEHSLGKPRAMAEQSRRTGAGFQAISLKGFTLEDGP